MEETTVVELNLKEEEEQQQQQQVLLVRCVSCSLAGDFATIQQHAEQCVQQQPEAVSHIIVKTEIPEVLPNNGARTVQVVHPDVSEMRIPEESFHWPRKAVLLLIETYEGHILMFRSSQHSKQAVWRKIGGIMKEKGFDVTPRQANNKWKFLKRHYGKVKERKNVPITWPYFQAMEALLGRMAAIELLASSSSSSADQAQKRRNEGDNDEPLWVKKLRADMNQREQQAQKRHEEYIQVQKDSQTMFEKVMMKFIDVIKKN